MLFLPYGNIGQDLRSLLGNDGCVHITIKMLLGRGLSFPWGVAVFMSLSYVSLVPCLLARQIVQLSAELHRFLTLRWSDLHIAVDTAQKTQWMGLKNLVIFTLLHTSLKCTPPPFKINPIIDLIPLFNGWLLLMVRPVVFRGISIQWRLFSISPLPGMSLLWERS